MPNNSIINNGDYLQIDYYPSTANESKNTYDAVRVELATMAKTSECTQNYEPVCGTDGITYSNNCNASQQGVKVDYNGLCVKADYGYRVILIKIVFGSASDPNLYSYLVRTAMGQILTFKIFNNTQLPSAVIKEGDYLSISYNSATGNALKNTYDAIQISIINNEKRPVSSSGCSSEYTPVCGADGQTYANKCFAEWNMVIVSYAGECKPVLNSQLPDLTITKLIEVSLDEVYVYKESSSVPFVESNYCFAYLIKNSGTADYEDKNKTNYVANYGEGIKILDQNGAVKYENTRGSGLYVKAGASSLFKIPARNPHAF